MLKRLTSTLSIITGAYLKNLFGYPEGGGTLQITFSKYI